MKIALVHTPFSHRSFSENLKVVDEEFCLAPPIVLAYVAAILERANHEVMIIDANALKLSKEKTLEILKRFAPDIIGFRTDSYWFHRVVEWAGYFKASMGVKIVIGGINVTLYPEEALSHVCFDYGVLGEAVDSLPELIAALERHDSIEDIKGIAFKCNDRIMINASTDKIIDFNRYPFPARHLLPNQIYYSFTSQYKNYTIMMTSTGCPYRCNFCAISRLPYRERSFQNVLDEIEDCYLNYNVREIDFFDATFFINKERALEICEGILKRGIKIAWSCRSRVDVVDEDILREASKAGCKRIYYGIESVSSEILGNINKFVDKRQVEHAVDLTHKHGINTLGFFMVGSLGDTKDTILSSISFAKRLKLDFIQVCRTIAKPNTELNNLLINKHGRDYWREYILGNRQEMRLPVSWSGLSEATLEKYTRKFYRDFYFRPTYILRRISKLRSWEEVLKYIKVVIKWLFCNKSDIG